MPLLVLRNVSKQPILFPVLLVLFIKMVRVGGRKGNTRNRQSRPRRISFGSHTVSHLNKLKHPACADEYAVTASKQVKCKTVGSLQT